MKKALLVLMLFILAITVIAGCSTSENQVTGQVSSKYSPPPNVQGQNNPPPQPLSGGYGGCGI